MGHKTCTWDSDGKPEGWNVLEDVGVHGGYIRMDPQETRRVWTEMAHDRVKLPKHTLFRLTRYYILLRYAFRSKTTIIRRSVQNLKNQGKMLQFAKPLYRMLYAFFWVIPQRLKFISRRFGTLCSIFICRLVRVEWTRLRAILGYYTGKGLAWKWSESLGRRGQSGGGFFVQNIW